MRVRAALLVVAAPFLFAAACARTSVQSVNERAVGLPKPQIIVVHDFGVTPGDVSLDSAIGARLMQMAQSTPASEQELKVGREVARIVWRRAPLAVVPLTAERVSKSYVIRGSHPELRDIA